MCFNVLRLIPIEKTIVHKPVSDGQLNSFAQSSEPKRLWVFKKTVNHQLEKTVQFLEVKQQFHKLKGEAPPKVRAK